MNLAWWRPHWAPAIFLALAVVSAAPAAKPCGRATSTALITFRGAELGSVSVSNDATHLHITYAADEGWMFVRTRAHAARKPSHFPQTRSGAPIPDAFAYQADHAPAVGETTFSIPFDELDLKPGDFVYIAANAIMRKFSPRGYQLRHESVWGEGLFFRQRRARASFFRYVVHHCEPAKPCGCASQIRPGDFRTQSMGGWGAPAHGANPGAYRDRNFPVWFPNGLTVGFGGRTLTLTNARAVEAFLPQRGAPGALTQCHHDPSSTEAGVLAGQVVALTLNVGFDLCDSDFGASPIPLQELVVSDPESDCFGMTVSEVLQLASAILGGASTALSPERLNACLTRINEDFVNGAGVGGFLCLSRETHERRTLRKAQ